jgi:hypothetical protein
LREGDDKEDAENSVNECTDRDGKVGHSDHEAGGDWERKDINRRGDRPAGSNSKNKKMAHWSLVSGPGDDPLPPINTKLTQAITIIDKESMPTHMFYLTDFNPDPANTTRVKETNAKALKRREQVGGSLVPVFTACRESNKPKLVCLGGNQSARGEIYVTDNNRHDLLEVCRMVSWRAATDGNRTVNWRLLGVGVEISEGRLFILRATQEDEGFREGIRQSMDNARTGEWVPIEMDQLEDWPKRKAATVHGLNKAIADMNIGGQRSVAGSSTAKGKASVKNPANPMASMTAKQVKSYMELVDAQQRLRNKK